MAMRPDVAAVIIYGHCLFPMYLSCWTVTAMRPDVTAVIIYGHCLFPMYLSCWTVTAMRPDVTAVIKIYGHCFQCNLMVKTMKTSQP